MSRPAEHGDLGFTWRARKSGDVEVLHATAARPPLRGAKAAAFSRDMEGGDVSGAQQLMARVTGNYRRGNGARRSATRAMALDDSKQ